MTGMLRHEAIDTKGILQRLGKDWTAEVYGADSYKFYGPAGQLIIVSWDPDSDQGNPWLHASISHLRTVRMPSYSDMKQMGSAVWPDGHCYQVFAPKDQHISITPNVLHLWGRYDGSMVLPDFGRFGTI